jgi:ABC-type lipoprotein export system ATPase subunit
MVIVDELAAAATGGASVLVATHDPRLVTRSSTVLHLLDGRLVER